MLSAGVHYRRFIGDMINQPEDDDDEEEEEYGWMDLPDILLEDVFCLLTPKYRHYASQVCRRWYETFYAPRVWETFVLNSVTLTKRRFNIFKGYQRELCPRKTQVCLSRVGHLFKKIIINPLSDYYNLYEFLRILASFLGYFDEYPMPLLHTLDFTFACETRGISGVIVHGTGGKILEELKILLANLKHLKRLKLSQLLLDESEVSGLLEAAQQFNVDSLKILEIVNCTKGPYMLMEISNFNCLEKLVTSPQHISDETIVMIAGCGITELHIIQDTYTCETEPVSADAWKLCKEMAPYLRVVLKLCGRTKEELLLQPHAPVHEIHLETPYSKISVPVVISIVHFYHRHLEVFAQKCLPRIHGSRSFHERADSALVMLVRNCEKLRSLTVRDRISTATLLLLAKEGKLLKKLHVRKNALLKRSDWPRGTDWTDEFYQKIRSCSNSFEDTTEEVSVTLGQRWWPLTDRQFKSLSL